MMMRSDLPDALTKSIRNIIARVFAKMQPASPQELNKTEGRPDL